jgi:hypothetical protein
MGPDRLPLPQGLLRTGTAMRLRVRVRVGQHGPWPLSTAGFEGYEALHPCKLISSEHVPDDMLMMVRHARQKYPLAWLDHEW